MRTDSYKTKALVTCSLGAGRDASVPFAHDETVKLNFVSNSSATVLTL